ncbi:MarR family transcriptional regulator [Desulfovibrio oxamicus]|uniref:MarR family transcriptional regulator n=1 Tax=Nitratidesulfovibrio oxamicus TaxID=32016 RepID=A0ABS0J526_9BACT|nr:MarR family transcriptional regulator [Nitratidesulfovibrio oxamicus]MBG3877538.1 MarR family transcriptional regulator [Nitratidesulfovibrio oxamicus]
MNISTTEKLFHQLHYCMNLLHRGHGPHGPHGGRGGAHRGQGRVLAMLAERDGLSSRDLAALLRVQPPSLSELLDKLSRDGSIERRRHEEDQRMSAVFLTEKGRSMVDEVRQARTDAAEATLAGLTAEEQDNLSALLDKLIASLEAREGETGACRRMGGHGHGHGRGRHGCHGGEDAVAEGGRGGQHGHGPHGHGHHGHGPHGQGCCHAAHGPDGPQGRADAEGERGGCCGHGHGRGRAGHAGHAGHAGQGGQGGRVGRGRHDGFGPHGPRGDRGPDAETSPVARDTDAPENFAPENFAADAERDA